MVITDKNADKILNTLNTESNILMNDITVMNCILKSILSLPVHTIENENYIKVDDIVDVCKKGFGSLSSNLRKK